MLLGARNVAVKTRSTAGTLVQVGGRDTCDVTRIKQFEHTPTTRGGSLFTGKEAGGGGGGDTAMVSAVLRRFTPFLGGGEVNFIIGW